MCVCRAACQTVWSETLGNRLLALPLHFVHHIAQLSIRVLSSSEVSDDSAIVGCIIGGEESEYRTVINNFATWCELNNLQLNMTKTRELVVDLKRTKWT